MESPQSGIPVNARSCKHIKSLLGEEYEKARIALKTPDGAPSENTKPQARATVNQAKPESKRKRSEEDEEESNNKRKSSVQSTTAKSNSKRLKFETIPEAAQIPDSNEDLTNDNLAEINGVRPHVYLRDGQEHEIGSATG